MVDSLKVASIALLLTIVLPLGISLPIAVQMTTVSTLIIFIASHWAKLREDKRKKEGANAEERDVITGGQAYRFPVVASCALLGMFLALKFLPREWVSFFLTLYGVGFGGLAFANVLTPFVEEVPIANKEFLKKTFGYKDYFELSIADIISTILALPTMIWYYRKRHWLSNNILGASLALSAIDMLALGDFKSGAVLLSGLFFYDIFWVFGSERVFGSNVMVSVAKNFEGPIKLLFPKFAGATAKDTSMLGLGDIVIPGLFIALMLRFDSRPEKKSPSKSQSYFHTAIFAYVAGLSATYAALTLYNVAQPALLYLVPTCLGFPVALAIAKGELGSLWTYSEVDEDEQQKKEASIKNDAKSIAEKMKGEIGTQPVSVESKKEQ